MAAPEPPLTDGASGKRIWMRLSGAGLELAAITLVLGAIGAFLDRKLMLEKPLCSAAGGLVGFTLGLIRFIRLASSLSDQQRKVEKQRREQERGDDEGGPSMTK